MLCANCIKCENVLSFVSTSALKRTYVLADSIKVPIGHLCLLLLPYFQEAHDDFFFKFCSESCNSCNSTVSFSSTFSETKQYSSVGEIRDKEIKREKRDRTAANEKI